MERPRRERLNRDVARGQRRQQLLKVVAVTPAGRRRYLEILAKYVLRDSTIVEWQLWDNCRHAKDRQFLHDLAGMNRKICLKELAGSNGTNKSINAFYRFTRDPDVFYIRLDDDIVWLPERFGSSMLQAATAQRGRYLWWSPVVINNALCTCLLKAYGRIDTAAELTMQAMDPMAWRSGRFACKLHNLFLQLLRQGQVDLLRLPDVEVSCARFSVNCLAFFGEDARALGQGFCPIGVDEEEWISAVIPVLTGRPGRIVGSLLASHFSFFPQERHCLKKDILQQYAAEAGVESSFSVLERSPVCITRRIKLKLRDIVLEKLLIGSQVPEIRIHPGAANQIKVETN